MYLYPALAERYCFLGHAGGETAQPRGKTSRNNSLWNGNVKSYIYVMSILRVESTAVAVMYVKLLYF